MFFVASLVGNLYSEGTADGVEHNEFFQPPNRMESNSQLALRRNERRSSKDFAAGVRNQESGIRKQHAVRSESLDSFRTSAEKIERLERLASLGTLSAGLAHEIKNAMVAIRTFLEMLVAENKNAELAGIVKREVLRIDAIVSQMLRCASQPKPVLARVAVREILERSLGLVEPQLRGHGIRLTRSYLAKSDIVEADAHQLEQAFLNLFLNAFEASDHGDEITVATTLVSSRRLSAKTRRTADLLEVTIRDTGAGVPKEQLLRVFEPFFTTKSNGTGLGLSITRGIIEQHGGSIGVQSEVRQGTTFQVTLPVAGCASGEASVGRASPRAAG